MRRFSGKRRVALLMLIPWLVGAAGCGGDESTTEPVPTALLGSWVAISMMAGTQDLAVQGMNLSVHFSADGEYSYLISDDLLGMCEAGPDCNGWGEFSATATRLILDPGTSEAQSFAYSISGDTLTLTGSVQGVAVSLMFERS
jgi:hypothetical protein